MGLLVELERRGYYISREEETQARIKVGLETLKYYLHSHFNPEGISFWQYAPMETFDGKFISSQDVSPTITVSGIAELIISFTKKYSALLPTSIIRIEGDWEIDGVKSKGYFSINNNQPWRLAYGDVEADASHQALVDLFWKDRELKKVLVDRFMEYLLKETKPLQETTAIKWLCFSSGAPSRENITNLEAAYYRREASFLMDNFRTFVELNDWSKDYVTPYRLNHVSDIVFEDEEFKKNYEDRINRFKITRHYGNSLFFIAEKIGTFKELHEKLANDYIEPVIRSLSPEVEFESKIKRVIRRESKLDME